MITITLSDGTVLSGLELNGDNFISKTEITPDAFRGKLSKVTIAGDADEWVGEHDHMELVQIAHYTQATHGLADGWYFVLRDIPAAELERLQARGDIDYLAMMMGVEL